MLTKSSLVAIPVIHSSSSYDPLSKQHTLVLKSVTIRVPFPSQRTSVPLPIRSVSLLRFFPGYSLYYNTNVWKFRQHFFIGLLLVMIFIKIINLQTAKLSGFRFGKWPSSNKIRVISIMDKVIHNIT